MPPFPSTFSSLASLLLARDHDTNFTTAALASNATDGALRVVCAWPVSGQYGPGSRYLYYVLVAACVLARKSEWLRNACLAAALLFPAVAALHGIVLAATHVDGAVDMDVYGAFQLCTIGILAAPVTVHHSQTYWNDPGRNTIFIWTILILAGLLSLTVEFYRSNTSPCLADDGSPIGWDLFEWGAGSKCGLICSEEEGPFSPTRLEATSEIFVIPAPQYLSFGTGTLIAAACCIPAILGLVTMWNKILEINWRKIWGDENEDDRAENSEEEIPGTNGATDKRMNVVNEVIRKYLRRVEVPVFVAAVFAILVIGERNLWSDAVYYQTEPIQSVGQWAPIVGAFLGVLGSLYLVMAEDAPAENGKESSTPDSNHCTCQHHHHDRTMATGVDYSPSIRSARFVTSGLCESPSPSAHGHQQMEEVGIGILHPVASPTEYSQERPDLQQSFSNDLFQSPTRHSQRQDSSSATLESGSHTRLAKAAKAANKIGTFFTMPKQAAYDMSEFKQGRAGGFPQIPGESWRNPALQQTIDDYNQLRDMDASATPRARSRSRSRTYSIRESTEEMSQRSASPSPAPSPTASRRPHSNTMSSDGSSGEMQGLSSTISAPAPARRATLEVPLMAHYSPTRSNLPDFPVRPIVPNDESAPTIVVSADPSPPNNRTTSEPISSEPVIMSPPPSVPPHRSTFPTHRRSTSHSSEPASSSGLL